jgi:tripartite-type tricarboxylate transporter receptor subunit TctC
LSNPEARERVAGLGAAVETMTPDAYAKWLAAESSKWAGIAREAGIKPE